MTCERRHARILDRKRCERYDNPRRPDPETLLAMYATRTIERIADDCGVPYNTAATWIRDARSDVAYNAEYQPRYAMRKTS